MSEQAAFSIREFRSLTETPASITRWADSVFGKATDTGRSIERAREEFRELWEAWEKGESDENIAKEAADVCIVLMRLLGSLEHPNMIDHKMAINRKRNWAPDGTGHGYHIKDELPREES